MTPARLPNMAPHLTGQTFEAWLAKLPASAFASPQEIAAFLALPPQQSAKRPER